MPTLAALEMFVCVAQKGSFVNAARQLNASRTTASKHVSDLEAELGIRLFDRTTRSIRLTEAGANYLKHAQQALDALKRGREDAERFGMNPQGLLRISAPPSLSGNYMVSVATSFVEQFPNVDLDIQFEGEIVDLIEKEYDIALRIAELKDSSLIARKLANVPFVICASPKYLENNPPLVHPIDLTNHVCLNYTHKYGGRIWDIHSREHKQELHRIKVPSSFFTNNARVLLQMAINGSGIVLRPLFEVAEFLDKGELIPVLNDYSPVELGLFAVFVPGRHPPEKLRRFVDHIASEFRGIDQL